MFAFLSENEPERLINQNLNNSHNGALILWDKSLLLNNNTFLIHFQVDVLDDLQSLSFQLRILNCMIFELCVLMLNAEIKDGHNELYQIWIGEYCIDWFFALDFHDFADYALNALVMMALATVVA